MNNEIVTNPNAVADFLANPRIADAETAAKLGPTWGEMRPPSDRLAGAPKPATFREQLVESVKLEEAKLSPSDRLLMDAMAQTAGKPGLGAGHPVRHEPDPASSAAASTNDEATQRAYLAEHALRQAAMCGDPDALRIVADRANLMAAEANAVETLAQTINTAWAEQSGAEARKLLAAIDRFRACGIDPVLAIEHALYRTDLAGYIRGMKRNEEIWLAAKGLPLTSVGPSGIGGVYQNEISATPQTGEVHG